MPVFCRWAGIRRAIIWCRATPRRKPSYGATHNKTDHQNQNYFYFNIIIIIIIIIFLPTDKRKKNIF